MAAPRRQHPAPQPADQYTPTSSLTRPAEPGPAPAPGRLQSPVATTRSRRPWWGPPADTGRDGNEAFVTWGGLVRDQATTLRIVSAIVPNQRARQTPNGLLVTVDGRSLFEVNRALYRRGEVLAAQGHSHPGDAYHSDTDDCLSLVTLTGALSVVVPRFGADGLNGCRGSAWCRLTGPGRWALLGREDKVEIVHKDVS